MLVDPISRRELCRAKVRKSVGKWPAAAVCAPRRRQTDPAPLR